MFDRYWGSKESYNQWGTRHVKLISGPEDGPDFERRRLQSEAMTMGFNSSRRFATSSVSEIPVSGRGMPRERRSKSTAYIQSKKNSHTGGLSSSSVTQNLSQTSVGGGADDMQQYGRSPRTWIQKIEDWHRELKTQKEKKKAEKRRNKLDSRGDSGFASTNSNITRSSNIRRTRKSFSSSPPPRSYSKSQGGQAAQREISDDFDSLRSPVDRKANSVGPNKKKETAAEVPLSRSYSEPFHSPNGVLGRSPWPKPSKRVIPDEIDSQILIRSQDPHSEDFQGEEQLAELAERGRSRRDSNRNSGGSTGTVTRVASFHLPSDRRSLSKSILSSSADDYRASSTGRRSMNRSSMGSSQSYAPPPPPPPPAQGPSQEQRRSGSRRSSLSSSHNLQQQASERRSLSTAELLALMVNGAAAVSAPRNVEEKPSRHPGLADMRRPPLQYPKSTSASSNPYESGEQLTASPNFSQLRSTEFQDEDYDVMRSPYMQPKMRRNLSLPGADNGLQQQTQQQQQLLNSGTPKWMLRTVGKRPPTAESARVIRDRAHVVSYLQRKLSDASSLAGSISRSPRERMDASRLSGSSSNSSLMSDQIFGSSRSAKPYRKGSFSFFDKLSSDLENCLDDLNTSYSADLEFGSGAGDLGSDVGSTTMPLPAKKGTSALDEWRRRSSFAAYQSS